MRAATASPVTCTCLADSPWRSSRNGRRCSVAMTRLSFSVYACSSTGARRSRSIAGTAAMLVAVAMKRISDRSKATSRWRSRKAAPGSSASSSACSGPIHPRRRRRAPVFRDPFLVAVPRVVATRRPARVRIRGEASSCTAREDDGVPSTSAGRRRRPGRPLRRCRAVARACGRGGRRGVRRARPARRAARRWRRSGRPPRRGPRR